jgi:hypothetical protein
MDRFLNSMIRRALVTLAAVSVLSSAAHAQQIYRFVGEDGVTVFSDRQPASGQAKKVDVLNPPSTSTNEDAQDRVGSINQALDELAAERRQKAADEEAARKAQAQQKAACEVAKNRLEQIQLYPPGRRLVVSPDGTAKRVGWEEMQAMEQEARDQVQKLCGSD